MRSTPCLPRLFLNLANLILSLLRADVAELRCLRKHNIHDDIRHFLRVQLMGENIAHAFEHLRWSEILCWVIPMRDGVGATIVEASSIHSWVHSGNFDTERGEFSLQPFGYSLERMLTCRISGGVRNSPQSSHGRHEDNLSASLGDHGRDEALNERDARENVDLEH